MNDEDFDGSALRELLTPAVADRGLTSAPADAIVAAGRRRVVGRRSAIAGGALAIVAAVPLAASAIAAGPGAATNSAASGSGAGVNAAAPGQIKHDSAGTLAKTESADGPAGLPAEPFMMASGTVEGKSWSVTAEQAPGNNALTAGDKCLGLILKVDGRYSEAGPGPLLPYCFPLPAASPKGAVWGLQETLKYYFTGGAGTVQMGMVPSGVAKIVAHVDGLAPVTGDTVPAPGLKGQAFYFLSIPKDTGFRVSFDEYNAQGVKIGSFNNWTPVPGVPAGPTSQSK